MAEIFFEDEIGILYTGDSVQVLKDIPKNSVSMVMTSPPYWSLRNYLDESRQLGQEKLFKDYIYNLANYLHATWDVLKDNGSLWVNIGDTYYGSNKGAGGTGAKSSKQNSVRGAYYNKGVRGSQINNSKDFKNKELPRKSLCMIPARFAIAMQEKGWILRNQIVWHKPNQMPLSVKDRFTVDYEVIYLFTKIEKSYKFNQQLEPEGRNKRTVWSINTESKQGLSHFATYPEKLVVTPILAGSNEGDIILDPFFGSGTTAVVAERLNRKWVGIELNKEYCGEAINRVMSNRKDKE